MFLNKTNVVRNAYTCVLWFKLSSNANVVFVSLLPQQVVRWLSMDELKRFEIENFEVFETIGTELSGISFDKCFGWNWKAGFN
jgi:hypothetical protein